MLKGDIGLKSIFAIVLSLMVLSLLISVTSVGSLGGALLQGFDEIGDYTDYTTEIEDRETLSDLTLFVEQRAMNQGCDVVAAMNEGTSSDPRPQTEEGYPGLEESHLGRYPDCFGGEASLLRDSPLSIGGPDENYMTGIFSRERFEFNEDTNITFSSTESGASEVWLDDNIGGFYDGTLESLDGEMEVPDDDGEGWTPSLGDVIAVVGGGAVGNAYLGVQVAEAVYDDIVDSETDRVSVTVVFQDNNVELADRTNQEDFENMPENPDEDDLEDIDYNIRFCEGDKGYIQSNRGTIANSDGTSSMEPLFPVIVVEESEHSECGEVQLGRGDMVPENTATSGRVLYITGKTNREHPYVRGPALGGSDRDFAFDLHSLNEDNDNLFNRVSSSGRNIDIDYDSDRSDECVIGIWDHRSTATDAEGYITFERGAHIDYDGSLIPRYSNLVGTEDLEVRDEPGLSASAEDLYDTYVNDGFTGGYWDNSASTLSVSDKIVYDYAGDRRFELYGDLLCVPHSNNDAFDDDHSEWKMCESEEEITVNGETWSCDPMTGEWDLGSQSGGCSVDSDCGDPNDFTCQNQQCYFDPV